MNKFFVSIGLAAVGTASLHAAYTPEPIGNGDARSWDVSATLRGFYDDNINTASPGPNKKDSLGFEVSPTLEVAVPLQQTELGLRYVYGLYYYQERQDAGQNPVDQSHQLDLWLDHAFTTRWQFKGQDSFRVGQEPQLIDPTTSVPTRTSGNNFANTATMTLDTDWTRLFSTEVGYQNNFYDYQNSGGTAANPSLAGILNRDENSLWLDLQWHVLQQTMAFAGYRFTQVNYTAGEPISQVNPPIGTVYYSDARDNRSHYFYVGAQQNFSANLTASGRVGVQYTDDYNDNSSQTAPYVDVSATYTYLPGSYVQIGFTQQQNATDVVAPDASGKITQSQESSTGFASINHKLNERLLASLIGRVQYSTYNSGLYNNNADTYYSMGFNLAYTISDHFSADAGYNFDYLDSGIAGREYHRNRVYLGVTASY